MKKFLRAIDFYGKPIKLTINNKDRIKTLTGGCLTIFTTIVLITFSWYIGRDIILRKKPISFIDSNLMNDYPQYLINKSTFPLAFAFTDFNSVPIVKNDSIYFELHIFYYKLNNMSGNMVLEDKTLIELKTCDPSDFPMMSEESFREASLHGFVCPISENLFLEGDWTKNTIKYLNLSVKRCDYNTNPNFCKNREKIDNYIIQNYININVISVEYSITVTNYENPIIPTLQTTYKYINSKYLKISDLYIGKNILYTDDEFFFDSYQEIEFYNMQEKQTELLDINDDKEELVQINIFSSNKYKKYYRKYIKITDILASVAGLFKFLVLGFSFLKKPFMNFEKFLLIYENLKNKNKLIRDSNNNFVENSIVNLFNKNVIKNKAINFSLNNKIEKNRPIKSINDDKEKKENKILNLNINNSNNIDLSNSNKFKKLTRSPKLFNHDKNINSLNELEKYSSINFLKKNERYGQFAKIDVKKIYENNKLTNLSDCLSNFPKMNFEGGNNNINNNKNKKNHYSLIRIKITILQNFTFAMNLIKMKTTSKIKSHILKI